MAKTRLDIVTMAHRRLGVLSVDETATADQIDFAGDTLDGIVGELESVHGLTLSWDGDSVPDGLYLPVAYLLAADIAGHYEVPPRDNRVRMIGKIRAYELPDDRDDRRDTDDSGTITTAEIDADARAVYF